MRDKGIPNGIMLVFAFKKVCAMKFEYKVVSAPKKGLRGKGVRGADDRFANALMEVMNALGLEGWEYQRTDTLPVEARSGLTGKATQFQNMMVFRRELTDGFITCETTPETPEDVSAETIDAPDTASENNAPSLPSPSLSTPTPPSDAQSAPQIGAVAPAPKTQT